VTKFYIKRKKSAVQNLLRKTFLERFLVTSHNILEYDEPTPEDPFLCKKITFVT